MLVVPQGFSAAEAFPFPTLINLMTRKAKPSGRRGLGNTAQTTSSRVLVHTNHGVQVLLLNHSCQNKAPSTRRKFRPISYLVFMPRSSALLRKRKFLQYRHQIPAAGSTTCSLLALLKPRIFAVSNLRGWDRAPCMQGTKY